MVGKSLAPEIEKVSVLEKTPEMEGEEHSDEKKAGSYLQRLIQNHPEESIKSMAAVVAGHFGIAGEAMKRIIEKLPTAAEKTIEKGTNVIKKNTRAVQGSVAGQLEKIFGENSVIEGNGKENYKDWAWNKKSPEEKTKLTNWTKKLKDNIREWKKEHDGATKDISKENGGVTEKLAQNAKNLGN